MCLSTLSTGICTSTPLLYAHTHRHHHGIVASGQSALLEHFCHQYCPPSLLFMPSSHRQRCPYKSQIVHVGVGCKCGQTGVVLSSPMIAAQPLPHVVTKSPLLSSWHQHMFITPLSSCASVFHIFIIAVACTSGQQGRDGEASLIVTDRHDGSTYH